VELLETDFQAVQERHGLLTEKLADLQLKKLRIADD